MTTHKQPWPAGTPCWADIMVPDVEAAEAFYSAVLGWAYTEPVADFGGYRNAQLGDRVVAGLCPTMPGMEDAPKVWTVYFATDDIAATAAAVEAAGGSTVGEVMQLGPLGSMGVFTDPTGVFFGTWQSAEHTGFEVVDEPGAVAWIDLMSSDAAAAREFYTAVFGFTYSDAGMGDMEYHLVSVPGGDAPAGGLGQAKPGDSSGWSVCFNVPEVDALVDPIAASGGAVIVQPYDFPFGRLLHATGSAGESFSLMSERSDQGHVT